MDNDASVLLHTWKVLHASCAAFSADAADADVAAEVGHAKMGKFCMLVDLWTAMIGSHAFTCTTKSAKPYNNTPE